MAVLIDRVVGETFSEFCHDDPGSSPLFARFPIAEESIMCVADPDRPDMQVLCLNPNNLSVNGSGFTAISEDAVQQT